VKVFVSQFNYRYYIEERNGLIKDIYPKLRDYCLQTYNIQFQYFDLRWGIQDQATDDHSTISIYLQEHQLCGKLSIVIEFEKTINRYIDRFY
jgi:hypothetical protein